jgi:hypothetical protein
MQKYWRNIFNKLYLFQINLLKIIFLNLKFIQIQIFLQIKILL